MPQPVNLVLPVCQTQRTSSIIHTQLRQTSMCPSFSFEQRLKPVTLCLSEPKDRMVGPSIRSQFQTLAPTANEPCPNQQGNPRTCCGTEQWCSGTGCGQVATPTGLRCHLGTCTSVWETTVSSRCSEPNGRQLRRDHGTERERESRLKIERSVSSRPKHAAPPANGLHRWRDNGIG